MIAQARRDVPPVVSANHREAAWLPDPWRGPRALPRTSLLLHVGGGGGETLGVGPRPAVGLGRTAIRPGTSPRSPRRPEP